MPVMVTDTPAKVSYLWSLQCTTSAYNLYWWERKRKGYYSPLLLSPFSRVRLCGTPETAAHQAPPSLGFSRQEHWSGLPSPSPMHESEREVAQLCQDSQRPHGLQPTRLLRPWDYPGKSTGVGCHCFRRCYSLDGQKSKRPAETTNKAHFSLTHTVLNVYTQINT